MTPIIVLHAECKYRMVYTCQGCGEIEAGNTVRVSFIGSTPQELEQFLLMQPPKTSAMPLDWSFDKDGFTCGKCRQENERDS